MKKGAVSLILLLLLSASCKKAEDRRCLKSTGVETVLEIPLDSVNHFNLYKNLEYHIVQDTLRKVIIRGGENLVSLVDVEIDNYVASVRNNNRCNFLRDTGDLVEVEIHYPYLEGFYIEPSDSVVFENTITSDSLFIELRDGGGSAKIDVDVNFLNINVSHGTADYTLTGYANNAEVKIQNNGFANATGFNAGNIFLYHNSTGLMKINLENTAGIVLIEGTGNVEYSGSAVNVIITTKGTGKFIKTG